MIEAWTKWESQIINGTFPLRRFLGGSNHSAVFLTEHKARQLSNAAIKLVPADPDTAEAQLSHWRTAAALSHPHLIRILDAGRCQLGGHQFLYVVMEYAEETLSQILPQRALTTDEVRQMLAPTLDALTFLHGKNLMQGQLKPANFLVVNDQLKLATDTIRQVGESAGSGTKSLYDPPEAKSGKSSPASDIWALGVTLVEALTQCPPAWPDARSESASLPTTLPASFTDIVRRCLSRSPENRPTVADLTTWIKESAAASAPSSQAPTPRAAPVGKLEFPRKLRIALAVSVVLILVAIWAGSRLFRGHPDAQQAAPNTSPVTSAQKPPAQTNAQTASPMPSAPAAAAPSSAEKLAESKPVPEPPAPPLSGESTESTPQLPSTQVLHEEIPDVPRSARNTIHGRIRVSVRVTVDTSGNVTDETLENAGPSKYFARLASDAARKWKFAPAEGDDEDSREWLLRFEFARGGTTAHAARPRS
jgi:TonB family protein